MKTTLEIPDPVFRRAKAAAARHGMALRAFVTAAVEEKLASASRAGAKPWLKLAGGLRHLHRETARIDQLLQSEFERIEPEDWA